MTAARLAIVALAAVCVAGCRQDMHDQPKYEPMERSAVFADQRAARPVLEDTVARGHLDLDEHYYRGTVAGKPATTFPAPVTLAMLERGRERYDIFCSPCHDRTGTGRGMIVLRGFPRAASLHDQRLRDSPPGHFFGAMTNGFGVMPSYATQIPVDDRWAIAAYIRALQLSQHAALSDVEPLKRELLESQGESGGE